MANPACLRAAGLWRKKWGAEAAPAPQTKTAAAELQGHRSGHTEVVKEQELAIHHDTLHDTKSQCVNIMATQARRAAEAPRDSDIGCWDFGYIGYIFS
jgi:hypothetical protein